MNKSLYKTLEIDENANEAEIKKAYKKLARKYHPDVNKDPSAEEKFKEINSAYEILNDKQKKVQYDHSGDSMFGGQNFHDFSKSHRGGGQDINDILNQMFSNGGGFSGFGGGFGGGFEEPQNLDKEIKITVPFITSILGGTHSINADGGSFDIKIPAGIKSGEKLRVKGKGNSGGSRVGDLYIKVMVPFSPDYIREDDNLIKTFDITLFSAMFGDKISIQTLEKEIKLNIPVGTKNAQRFRVKDMGVTNRKTKERGNLYLEVNIIIPKVDELDEKLALMMKEKLPKES